MSNIRTDLAIEAAEREYTLPKGVEVNEYTPFEGIEVTHVEILTEEGEKALGKQRGHYITIESNDIHSQPKDMQEKFADAVAGELKTLIKRKGEQTVLIVGLGNRAVTPDALGPRVCEKVFVTRHIKEYVPESIDDRAGTVCAIAPGVLGVTGLETSEVIRGIVEKVKPGVVIAVDALASRKISRIGCSVQISDTGIDPGSGIGNKRKALTKETLGTDVIAVGVPMVVYAYTVASDLLESAEIKEVEKLAEKIMSAKGSDLIVTPKEIDIMIDKTAAVIADAINKAVNEGLSKEEIENYMQ